MSFSKTVARTILAALLVSASAAIQPAAAQSSIKVVVDDTAITTMDISSRARLLQLAQKLPAGASQKAAVEELIEDAIKLKEARRRGIVISDAQVDAAVAEVAARSKLSPAQFAQALGQAGVGIRTFKDRIRAQIAWGRVVRSKVQAAVREEQNDLLAQMRNREKGASEVTAEDYVLQRVVFTLPAKRSSDVVERRRREAEALRKRFTSCAEGIPMAKALKEVAVLNVGRRLASEVPPQLQEQVKETAEGRLTKPAVTDQGVEMFAVCDRITVTGESAVTASMDAEAMNAQAKAASDALIKELREKSSVTYR
ncbi:SurA N-terminal domain-containing protein [Chthonobacter albigriseus]|uniref:SurA N-terminal domain-containing protein n=1 Tax=Chthonobacter albigriseus TaxID=1683161 RepID=UPI0015EF8C5E|nr:SurA N-terminal domain-containing protein [Chthonobacter albigriseus]